MRTALLAFAGLGEGDPPPPVVADWRALLSACHAHGLVPLAARSIQGSDYPTEAKQAFRYHALAADFRTSELRETIPFLLESLGAEGVEPVLLKGPALADTVYPIPSLRPYADLDLLCHEQDWAPARRAMLDLGFRSINGSPAPPPRAWDRKPYYHNQYYRDEDRVLVEIHYDPWDNSLRPRLGDLYWRRAVHADIDGTAVTVLSPEDQIINVAVHLHQHSYGRLIWFTDLAMLLRNTPDIDWGYLVGAARTEGIDISVYYSLDYTERLLGVGAPGWVMGVLRPGPLRARLHDRYWPPASIPRLEVDDRVDFHFEEVPRAIPLLRSILLTGRRSEKLAYLARLLVPPGAWLARYHDTNDPSILRRRRLAHAPRLLVSLIGQLVSEIRGAGPRPAALPSGSPARQVDRQPF